MGTKKNYMNLLKEAISEFDTSKTQSIKGPMLDPILSWEGDGELPTYKDAGSILERYYFNENNDDEIETLDEADYENDKGADGKGMKHAQGDAGPQAGTSDKKTIKAVKDEIEDEIETQGKKVSEADGLSEADDKKEDDEADKIKDADEDADEKTKKDDDDEEIKEELEMENQIIEKLIAEMEADDDAQGAGTQQAGTGDADKLVPDRKDEEKTSIKAKNYNEDNDLIEAALAELEDEIADEKADEKDEDEEEKELDVDKEVSEAAAPAGVPGGPSPKKKGEDYEDDEAAYSEAFNLFKEAIEDDVEE